jgi:hypothetical protein
MRIEGVHLLEKRPSKKKIISFGAPNFFDHEDFSKNLPRVRIIFSHGCTQSIPEA